MIMFIVNLWSMATFVLMDKLFYSHGNVNPNIDHLRYLGYVCFLKCSVLKAKKMQEILTKNIEKIISFLTIFIRNSSF